MGFWGTLGKIASVAAPIAAIPFTGGASALALGAGGAAKAGIGATIGKIASAAAPVLGSMAKDRAAGKVADASANLGYDRLNLSRGDSLNQALMQEFAAKLGLSGTEADLMDRRVKQTREGDYQANVQDLVVPGNSRVTIPHITGGRRPSALGPNARAAGRLSSSIALGKLGNEGLPSTPNLTGNVPGITPLPGTGVLDKILGVASPAAALFAAVQPNLPKKKVGGYTPEADLFNTGYN